jgi:uncharacterized delta-60 repeat protein
MRTVAIALQACCSFLLSAPWLSHAQVQQAWVQRYRGGNSQYLSAGPAVATNGDIYLTGVLSDAGESQFATVKYSAAGSELWATRYNGAIGQPDVPSAVRVLPDGYLIVSGKSGPYHSNIFATVKYSPAGTEVWARRHSVLLDGDHRTVLAVSPASDIYVACATSGSTGYSDIVTLKYSAEGTLQWEARFVGLGAQNDTVAAIAADASGNVYIAGSSSTGADVDYYVVKYDPNGSQVWAARYDGPLGQFDSPAALLVDAAGNAYVTGTSLGQSAHGASRYELATIKYDFLGNQVWVSRYLLPGSENMDTRISMSFDGAGNIIIASGAFGQQEQECALLKYDTDGRRLWAARYNGAAAAFDGAYALAVDGAGNAYVSAVSDGQSGWEFVTLKYDSYGNRLWTTGLAPDGIFDFPVGIDLHANGDIYIAGQSQYFEGPGGFFTVKYTQTNTPPGAPAILAQPASQIVPGGTNVAFSVTASGAAPLHFQWRFNGMLLTDATNSSLVMSDVALEQSGHYSVEVNNQFGTTATPEADLLVLIPPTITSHPQDQFAFAGTEASFTVSAYGTEPFTYQWFHDQIPMPAQDRPLLTLTNLQIVDSGEYYVVILNQSGSVTSAVTRLTVSPQLQQDWVRTYDGPSHGNDANPLVELDLAGNVYVAGTSQGESGSDVVLIKYSSSGSVLWTARYTAPSNSSEIVSALVVDPAGDVWITGSTATSESQPDALTLKYSSGGALLWAARFGATNLFETATAIAVDSSGNAYVAGQTDEDFLTIKYDAGGNQLWTSAFNGSAQGIDTARSVATDGTNIYVVGSSWNGSNLDFLTVNYDPQGNMVWHRLYDAGGPDHAVAVVIDHSRNVMVTGNSLGTVTYGEFGTDYLVVKYAPNGERLWTARYDGFMNAEDYPTALAVDPAGNVYVTGHSDFESGDSGVRQFATLKYGPDGRELWRSWHISRQYDGSRSLEVDGAGNVYITGLGTGTFSGRNISFIQYDQRGNRIATIQYNGSANSDDTPSALAVDSGGNVFVTGASSGDSETGLDFVLIKYSQHPVAGLPTITSVPRSLDIAQGSNAVFSVTAVGEAPLAYQWMFNGEELEGATDPVLAISNAQFENAGTYSLRVANSRGTVVSPAIVLVVQSPPTILIQPQTQVAVAGSTVLLSVNTDGSLPLFYQWFRGASALSNETSQVLTLSNVQPSVAGEYCVVVSNRVGSVQSTPARVIVTLMARQCWERRYESPGGDAEAVQAMAVGSDGSALVTGFSIGPAGADYLTVKYDSDGNQLWAARYNGPENGHDFAADIAVDLTGNAFVTGRSWGGTSGVDIVTVKYDPAGNEVWSARFNTPDNLEDAGRAITVDDDGNVYVAGFTIAAPYNPDFITIHYTPSGTQLWTARYDGPVDGVDEAVDVAVDTAGRVYVTGTSTLSGANTDFATIKYDTNGAPLWVRRYSAAVDSDESAAKLRVDPSGNVYVAGTTRSAGAFADYAVVKYSGAGDQLWAFRYDGLRHLYDLLTDLLVDPDGQVYITGTSESSGGGADFVTLKLNPAGQRLWVATYGGSSGVADVAAALTFDSSGNVCVTGAINMGENTAGATFCYDTNGNRRWTALQIDPPRRQFPLAIGADQFGHVFVAGSSESDYFAVKYAQTLVAGAPGIISPPRNQSVIAGQEASFSVVAGGDGPLTYRWFLGRDLLVQGDGRTNLIVNNASDLVAGYYSVEVFNSLGWVASPAAELDVNGPAVPRFQVMELTNGYARLVLLAERGFTYQIEASPDLLNWSIVATNNVQNSSIEFIDSSTEGRRFYRAVKLP